MKKWSLFDFSPDLINNLRFTLGLWLEEKSPRLGKHLLSSASHILNPASWGMGLKIKDVSSRGVSVTLPARFFNRSEWGEVPLARIMALAEHSLKVFWERQVHVGVVKVRVLKAQVVQYQPSSADLEAQFEMKSQQTDETLFELTAKGMVETALSVTIYDAQKLQVATVDFDVVLQCPRVLPGGI